ncbi:MAG: hypothetical protein ABSG60_08165 [Terracidiphilus sp.]|jgi:hypothetical protein
MARHYSTRDFFRQMPNALLARYFQGRGVLGDLDFVTMMNTQREGGVSTEERERWKLPVDLTKPIRVSA